MHPFVTFLDKWSLNIYGCVDDFDNEGAIGAIDDNTRAMMNCVDYLANIFGLANNPCSLQIDLDTFKPLIESLFRIMKDPITSRLVNQTNRKIINKFIDKNVVSQNGEKKVVTIKAMKQRRVRIPLVTLIKVMTTSVETNI